MYIGGHTIRAGYMDRTRDWFNLQFIPPMSFVLLIVSSLFSQPVWITELIGIWLNTLGFLDCKMQVMITLACL